MPFSGSIIRRGTSFSSSQQQIAPIAQPVGKNIYPFEKPGLGPVQPSLPRILPQTLCRAGLGTAPFARSGFPALSAIP